MLRSPLSPRGILHVGERLRYVLLTLVPKPTICWPLSSTGLHHPVAISESYKIHHALTLTPPSSTEYSIVRNAGGRTSEALRSIVCIDTLIGLEAVIVVHHTGSFTIQPIQQLPKTIEEAHKECYIDCGLTHLTNASIRASLLSKDPSLELSVSKMDFGEIIEFVSYYPFSGTPALSYYIYM